MDYLKRVSLSLGMLRKHNKIEIKDLCNQCQINESNYKKFEKGTQFLTDFELNTLFHYYHIGTNIKKDYKDEFDKMYSVIYQLEDLNHSIYSRLDILKEELIYNGYYVDYILAKLSGALYKNISYLKIKDKADEINIYIELINGITKNLNSVYLSRYYDALGEYYRYLRNNTKALYYYNLAASLTKDNHLQAIILYHKGMVNIAMQNEIDALDILYTAKFMFDAQLNFNRSIQCTYAKGVIYLNLKKYEAALATFHIFKDEKYIDMIDMKLNQGRIHLCHFLMGDYGYIINTTPVILEDYFIKAFSYYLLGDKDSAINLIKGQQTSQIDFTFPGTHGIISMLRAILYNSKEQTFINACEIVRKYMVGEYRYIEIQYDMLVIEYYRKRNKEKYIEIVNQEIIQKLYNI